MELGPKTKLAELMSNYPFLKDFLIGMDDHFKALDNPFMMSTVGRFADLSKISMFSGVDLDLLIASIAEEIRTKTGESLTVNKPGDKVDEAPIDRIQTLKNIIKDLHKGVDKDLLVTRFRELIKDVAPTEIATMEQQLIAEGMPEEEIKKLCDVHVQVFREALDKKVMPGLPAGHPVHTLILENRAAEEIIQKINALEELSLPRIAEYLDSLGAIDLHYLRKENQLFPVLETKGISGPSKVMWALHDDIRAMLKHVKSKTSAGTVTPLELKTLVTMLNDMIYKEEHILFPMALETLSDGEWAVVRQGEEEIGYAWIEPEKGWEPLGTASRPELISGKVGSLNLDTGRLTVEQINLMLTHLPVDISFVNEHDEVVYYSQTADRIFPRSPGIIGRKVQNCHPPKSVDTVEKILDEFKSGAKSSADFWIQMRGRFIYIRYFAVRDGDGKYKGTLEVSQDLTDLRALQGEKRLLDW